MSQRPGFFDRLRASKKSKESKEPKEPKEPKAGSEVGVPGRQPQTQHAPTPANVSTQPKQTVRASPPSATKKVPTSSKDDGDAPTLSQSLIWIGEIHIPLLMYAVLIAIESVRIDPIFPDRHPESRIAEAQKKLQEAIEQLQGTLASRTVSSPNEALIDKDENFEKFTSDLLEVQVGRQHTIAGKLQSFVAKISPVVSFVLDTASFAADVRVFPSCEFRDSLLRFIAGRRVLAVEDCC